MNTEPLTCTIFCDVSIITALCIRVSVCNDQAAARFVLAALFDPESQSCSPCGPNCSVLAAPSGQTVACCAVCVCVLHLALFCLGGVFFFPPPCSVLNISSMYI